MFCAFAQAAATVAEVPFWKHPTVIAAWIGGAATITAAVIAKVMRNRAESAEKSLKSSFGEQLQERYGFRATLSLAEVEITDATGGCTMLRRWEGLTAHDGVTLGSIPGKIVGGDTASIQKKLKFEGPSAGFPKAVQLDLVRHQGFVIHYQVNVQGGLTSRDPPLGFSVTGSAGNIFLMTKEEVDKAQPHFKHEYVSSSVDFPVEKLVIKLRFGSHLNVRAYPYVFLGFDGEVGYPNPSELKRVEKGFKNNDNNSGAELIVESPLIGLLYVIYWDPPPAASAA